MWLLIIQALYFFLPAYLANLVPGLFRKIIKKNKFLSFPLDGGKKFKNQPLLGKNKTLGGILLALFFGLLVFYLQKELFAFETIKKVSLINYSEISFLFGFLLVFGAIFGDLAKSFFKRRFRIPPGKKWFPFDQIDFVLGALLFSFPLYVPSLRIIIIILIISPILHIVFNHLGYYLKMQENKW